MIKIANKELEERLINSINGSHCRKNIKSLIKKGHELFGVASRKELIDFNHQLDNGYQLDDADLYRAWKELQEIFPKNEDEIYDEQQTIIFRNNKTGAFTFVTEE